MYKSHNLSKQFNSYKHEKLDLHIQASLIELHYWYKSRYNKERSVMYVYTCKKCGITFKHRKKNKKFCSTKCMYSARNEKSSWRREIRKCLNCENGFYPTYKQQKYCTIQCSAYLTHKKSERRKKTYDTKCGWCGKEFKKELGRKGKHYDFCSQQCSQSFIRGNKDKYITKQCPKCKVDFQCLYRKQKTFCSYSCSKSGENHPFYGKQGPTKGIKPWTYGKTKETDERISILGKKVSKTHKDKFEKGIRSNSGENNPNHKNKRKRKERTKEQKDRYSKAAVWRIENYGHSSAGDYFSTKTNKLMRFRSKLERRFMAILDNRDDVIYYEHEPFSIRYDVGKRYMPDFLVYFNDHTKKIIEVKSDYIKNLQGFYKKEDLIKKYCNKNGYIFELWNEKLIEREENKLCLSG